MYVVKDILVAVVAASHSASPPSLLQNLEIQTPVPRFRNTATSLTLVIRDSKEEDARA